MHTNIHNCEWTTAAVRVHTAWFAAAVSADNIAVIQITARKSQINKLRKEEERVESEEDKKSKQYTERRGKV